MASHRSNRNTSAPSAPAASAEQGWFQLAVVLDLFSRKVVGWAMDTRFTRTLVGRALSQALEARTAPALLNSDRGVQYASDAYQQVLAAADNQCSTRRRSDCYDNAVVGSFFASLKGETILAERDFANPDEARRTLFACMEGLYNTRRLHSTLGYRRPDVFEKATASVLERGFA